MHITKGKLPGAKKVVIFGPEGIGKSTFASRFPNPLFIDTENGTKELDVIRFDSTDTWEKLKQQVRYVIDHPELCRTLVLDTADWAEKLEIEDLCRRNGWNGIEAPGYGKGYTYSAEEFGTLLDLLSEVVRKGIHVVVTAHAQLRKVELPEEIGAYDHWEMKTSKKVAPMIREWADAVFFANYKVTVVNVDSQGAVKGKNKVQGGRRMLYTCHTPFWDAKNRFGLPEELTLSYQSVAAVFEDASSHKEDMELPFMDEPLPFEETETIDSSAAGLSADSIQHEAREDEIPSELSILMQRDRIIPEEIQAICASKGYVPQGTLIRDFESVRPGLIREGLIRNWDSVVSQVRSSGKDR